MADKTLPYARVVLKLDNDEVSIPVHTRKECAPSPHVALQRIATDYRDQSSAVPVNGRLIRQRGNLTLATWTDAEGFAAA